jgi:putative membrane protein insertion efficiency factor
MRNYAKTAAIKLIELYQATFSPDHGLLRHLFPYGYCRHHPTCSAYGKQVIVQHGVIIGAGKIFWRVLRCNPWTKPDPRRITGKRVVHALYPLVVLSVTVLQLF